MYVIYMTDTIIRDAYYDPTTGLSASKLYAKLRDKGITRKQVKEFLEKQEAYQLRRRHVRPKTFIPIVSTHPNKIHQLDLMDMTMYGSRSNSGIKYLLMDIDVFTRKLIVIPIKNKTTASVVRAMEEVLAKAKPEKVQCDRGKEFISVHFKIYSRQATLRSNILTLRMVTSLA